EPRPDSLISTRRASTSAADTGAMLNTRKAESPSGTNVSDFPVFPNANAIAAPLPTGTEKSCTYCALLTTILLMLFLRSFKADGLQGAFLHAITISPLSGAVTEKLVSFENAAATALAFED